MTEWLRKRSGWITLILLAAVYYPLFGKGVRGLIFYVQAGNASCRTSRSSPARRDIPIRRLWSCLSFRSALRPRRCRS